MKSVIAVHPGHLEILDTPVPKPEPYQALVKTECACLCNRTDSERLHGNFPGMEDKFPFVLGHESVGIVTAVGEKVRNFAVGDRAVGGLSFELQMEGVDSGWGGFGEYTLANDHAAMVEAWNSTRTHELIGIDPKRQVMHQGQKRQKRNLTPNNLSQQRRRQHHRPTQQHRYTQADQNDRHNICAKPKCTL